jgi:2-amino-4-hydroxy-6-hydroxymethyldihydropteridine diphosphokinase
MICLAIGSNLEPLKNIPEALRLLKEKVTIQRISSFYESEAFGIENSPRFVNGACSIATHFSFEELKSICKKIEGALGRERQHNKNAPRPIDLDILIFDHFVDSSIYSRPFLSIPLSEISPFLILPDTGTWVGTLAAQHSSSSLELLKDFSLRAKQEVVQ